MNYSKFHILYILPVIVFLTFPFCLFSQSFPELDARKAVYARVEQYKSRIIGNVDSVILADANGFSVDDTVLFFQTLGGDPDEGGEIFQFYYTGKYAIMKIQEIVGDTVVFNSTLPDMSSIVPKPGEVAQLIKIPTYKKVRVTEKFANDSAYWAWDPLTSTGGVFPLIAGRLDLETDFSANGQGFKGGEPDGEYGGVCSSSSGDTIYERVGMFTDAADSAGRKGGSNARLGYLYTKGFENVGNGGGGGNGKYSGGGGGGNAGYGSKGGYESESCTSAGDIGGKRGEIFPYTNLPGFYYNRIALGGGGGTGTQNPSVSRFATKGGDGGGIIILLVDSLVGNGYALTANGEPVTEIATAGAGGGGGGGVIVIDVGYQQNVTFEAKGGNGGNVSSSYEKTGPGGAGGGGVVWYNQNVLFPAQINVTAGKNGTIGVDKYGADGTAGNGIRFSNLILPLKGFIINPLPDDQNICEGDIPAPFMAAKPKGGDGTYSYQWLISESIVPASFNAIPGATSMTYQHPAPLTKTTFFKRRVSTGAISDETFYITVEVTPKIENNTISENDTICQGLAPNILNGSDEPLLSGGLGSGSYSFQWQFREDNAEWMNISEATSVNYSPATLNDTTYFRRVVKSGICSNISDSAGVIVLPSITGNEPATNQNVYCNNQEILPITSDNPGGGDGSYSYLWESKIGNGAWIPDGTSRNHPSVTLVSDGSLTQTYHYRRTVFSGPANTCENHSPEITITVLPDITNNSISVAQDTLCASLPSITITGSSPAGADGDPYTFKWETSINGISSWAAGNGTINLKDYQPGSLNASLFFRRTVTDGPGDVCSSVSNVQKITILPKITGNTIASDQAQCVGEITEILTGSSPAGGDGKYSFQWQEKTGEGGVWQNTVISARDFNEQMLNEPGNYMYRRIVTAGENNTCADTSGSVTILVEAQISGNEVELTSLDACFNSEIIIQAETAIGGDGLAPDYIWQDSLSGGSWQNSKGDYASEDYIHSNLIHRTWFRRVAISKSGLCSSISQVVEADTLTLPSLLELTSLQDTICNDIPYSLFLDFKNLYYGPFEVEYTNGKETITVTGVTDRIYFPAYDRPFEGFEFQVLSVKDVNNCFAVGDFSDVVPLWVNQAPSPGIVKPSEPFEYCGPSFQLTSDPDLNPGVYPGWWETGAGSQLTVNDAAAATGNFSIGPGFDRYSDTIFFKQETKSCGSRADTLVIHLFEQPAMPVIYRGDETVLYITDKDTLKASPPSAGNFEWALTTAGATLDDPLSNPVLVNDIPLDFPTILTYTVSNGLCQPRTAEIAIHRREVNVYDGISPENQDGLNDFLVAEGLDTEGVSFVFQLFSSSGMLIKEITQSDLEKSGFMKGLPNNGLEIWDGKDRNGNSFVPEGTYYYVLTIDYKGVEFIDKGFVLVR